LRVNRLVQRGQEQVRVSAKIAFPHCARCTRNTQTVFLAGCIPYSLGFLIVGGLAFLIAVYGAFHLGLGEYGQPHNANELIGAPSSG
jgi:hypothetical protein